MMLQAFSSPVRKSASVRVACSMGERIESALSAMGSQARQVKNNCREENSPPDSPVFKTSVSSYTWAGSIRRKDATSYLEGFAEARRDIDPEVQLAIAGPGSSSYIAELKRLACELKISNRIHWLGMLRGDCKWGALRSAEAFILPSHQENFGIAVAEAMACSTPVLISNKVNIWREIDASKGGLVQPDTADGTHNLIRQFYRKSAEERAQMSSAAREGFLRNFEIEAAALDFARIIGFAPSCCC